MTLDSLILLTGVLVATMPFLGFPNSWDRIIFLVLGIVVIALGIIVRRRTPRKSSKRDALFEEHMPARSATVSEAHEDN